MLMSVETAIEDIDKEIEETETDISWSDNPETIKVLEEKIERLKEERQDILNGTF